MREFIPSARRQPEVDITIGEPGKVVGQIEELLSYEMDNLPLALDLSVNRHHACSKDDAAPFFEKRRPDDDVARACLIFDRDKHHALGATRLLPDEDER